jgi:DNA-binding HxlR family transcriptional regulator
MSTMTAGQRRELERRAFLAAMDQCQSRRVLDSLSNKWVTLILRALGNGPLRRGDLSRAVIGATQKVLTQTLRALEQQGYLSRTIVPSVPVRVEYELTPLGRDLLGLVRTISDWAEEHSGQLERA